MMPLVTWKIMLRRANQEGYHYLTTQQRGWAPTVGEEVKIAIEGRTVKWTIVEILRDNSLKVDAFTVKVEETREM
jgi:hypothetical protein